MPAGTFSTTYSRLNPAQRQAVDTIDGPVLVLAGPGTGKTQVLAARIANILLKTDTKPESILALTFTESAAKNMRERLVSMIGTTAYSIQITTFHAFCSGVISSHPEYFVLGRESEALTDLERFELYESIIEMLPLEVLKPLSSTNFYLKDMMKAISDLKREGVTVKGFKEIVAAEQAAFEREAEELKKTEITKRQKNLAKQAELSQIYEVYQQRLGASGRYDYDDMIILVVEAFKQHELLLLEYQENIHYLLIDEYQDTNSAQNQVVDLLASFWGEDANVFAVGDPNQAIYRFQGASLENVVSFIERYAQAQVITLTEGYRSTTQIYQASAALIIHNTSTELAAWASPAQLTSVTGDGQPLLLYRAPSQTLETVFVAEAITQLLAQGIEPEEIAVLFRNNGDALEISEALDKWGIRYDIDGGSNALEIEEIRQLLTFFKVMADVRHGREDRDLYQVLQYPWFQLRPLLVMQVARAAARARLSMIDLISSGYETFCSHHPCGDIPEEEFAQLQQWLDRLRELSALDTAVVFTEWFETVIKESGYLEWLMSQPTKVELLNALNSLFREVRALVGRQRDLRLEDFLQNIVTMQEHSLPITVEDLNIGTGAVRLSTVHKAKGQEWQYVFILQCIDGKWGNTRSREMIPLPDGVLKHTDASKKERNEDDRRLFYVALTRAKTQVCISYPETYITENRTRQTMGSVFIEEIADHFQPALPELQAQVRDEAETHLARLMTAAPKSSLAADERRYFEHLVKDFSLSATSLNTYLHAPEDFVESCLLRVPQATSVALAFGTAVHSSLERLYQSKLRTGEYLPLEKYIAVFEQALRTELLLPADIERRLTYGRRVLTEYFTEVVSKELTEPLAVERFFGGSHKPVYLGDVALTGRIDRVDWLDHERKLVRVIDYKTGKPKSLGDIEGKTVAAGLSERERMLPEALRGSYKRQLLFYKLLADLDPTFVPTVTSGVFDFVEPDKQTGKLVRRELCLPGEEVELLKELIREVMREIRGLAFLE